MVKKNIVNDTLWAKQIFLFLSFSKSAKLGKVKRKERVCKFLT